MFVAVWVSAYGDANEIWEGRDTFLHSFHTIKVAATQLQLQLPGIIPVTVPRVYIL